MKFKVIAHVSTDPYDWKILVELNRGTAGRLMSEYGPSLPRVGSEIDITNVFNRLSDLESRERSVSEFRKLLGSIAPESAEPGR